MSSEAPRIEPDPRAVERAAGMTPAEVADFVAAAIDTDKEGRDSGFGMDDMHTPWPPAPSIPDVLRILVDPPEEWQANPLALAYMQRFAALVSAAWGLSPDAAQGGTDG